ncbi:MAG: class A beta-lactamase-related serine hydrolase [Candidatus Eremiobacteraeota bacterium]|nr:class A beta-lactamase-related serine hydrolase [Candidatus Eremiobacteraeota bacterium]
MDTEKLQKVVEKASEEMGGGILSVGYENFTTGEKFFFNKDHIFPAASIVKVPILLEYFHQVEQGDLKPDEIKKLEKSDKVGGAGVLFELHDGLKFTLQDLVVLMIVVSDNTASNMMLDRLGMDEINAYMRTLGLSDTVIGRKFMIDPKTKFSKNFTSVQDMVKLYEKLYRGEILNGENTKEAVEILSRQQYREKIPLLLPKKTKVAHKTGEITGVRHDCAMVLHDEKPYTLCILTEELPDVIKADRIIAELSLAFFNETL